MAVAVELRWNLCWLLASDFPQTREVLQGARVVKTDQKDLMSGKWNHVLFVAGGLPSGNPFLGVLGALRVLGPMYSDGGPLELCFFRRRCFIGPGVPIPNDPGNKVRYSTGARSQVFLRPGLPDSGKTMKVNIQNATTQMLRRSHLLGRSTVEQTFLSVMGAVPKSWLAKPHRIPAPQVPRSTELQFRPPLQRQPGNSLPGGDENRRPSRLRCPGAEAPDNGRS